MGERNNAIQWAHIEPLCVLRLLLRKLWLIVLAALIGAMGAWVVLSCAVSHSYCSTTTFVVTARSSDSYYSHTGAASEVVSIYSELLQSRFVGELTEKYAPGTAGIVTANQIDDTNLISVKVTSESPRDALLIMQALLKHYGELSSYVSSTAVLTPLNTPNVTVTAAKSYNSRAVCGVSALAGAVLMAAILTWICVSSGTVQNEEGAKNDLDAGIIAVIPHEKRTLPHPTAGQIKELWHYVCGRKREERDLNISAPTISFGFAEAIRRVAAKFEHARARGCQVFLFSSVSEAEGKSTLAANTALALAENKEKVLFIDLDLRRPVQSRLLGLKVARQEEELGAMLVAGRPAEEILQAAVTDAATGLQTLLSTKSYVSMLELITADTMIQVLELARERFDYVIIDSPPMSGFADSEIFSDLADASVLVVRQDIVPAPEINDAIDALRAGKAEFLGCILNDMQHLHVSADGYGYGYGTYGKYGKYGKYGSRKTAEEK